MDSFTERSSQSTYKKKVSWGQDTTSQEGRIDAIPQQKTVSPSAW